MDKTLKEYMSARCILLSRTIKELDKKIEHLPDGRIYVRNRNGRPYFYSYEKKTGMKYLSKEDNRIIKDFIQKDYLKSVRHAAEKEYTALKRMRDIYPDTLAEDIFDQLPAELKQYAKPVVPADGEYVRQWMNKPYEHPGFKNDMPVYITLRGERVRSKSEMIIADRLWANGIPYKYECPLRIGDWIIHPDFTILRLSDRKIIYHEHCGMMDNQDYKEDMVERVNGYNLAGIFLGDRLFLSFESSKTPLDVRVIDNLINTHFK